MKLYALRDRLLDYFQQPFIGRQDQEVLAAVSLAINSGDNKLDFAQAPQHFELWSLAEIIQETGYVRQNAQLIADCSSLVRSSVRQADRPGETAVPDAARASQGAPSGLPRPAGPEARAAPNAAPAAPVAPGQTDPGPAGGAKQSH